MQFDASFLLMVALAGFLAGGAVLLFMVLPVEDYDADAARAKGLLDPTSPDGTFNPLPPHHKFLHPATTAYWGKRGWLPLLTGARVIFYGSIIMGLVGLVWLMSGSGKI